MANRLRFTPERFAQNRQKASECFHFNTHVFRWVPSPSLPFHVLFLGVSGLRGWGGSSKKSGRLRRVSFCLHELCGSASALEAWPALCPVVAPRLSPGVQSRACRGWGWRFGQIISKLWPTQEGHRARARNLSTKTRRLSIWPPHIAYMAIVGNP